MAGSPRGVRAAWRLQGCRRSLEAPQPRNLQREAACSTSSARRSKVFGTFKDSNVLAFWSCCRPGSAVQIPKYKVAIRVTTQAVEF